MSTPGPLESADGAQRVYFHSSERMDEIPDKSIDLVLTSPPYGIGLNYSGENLPPGVPGSTPGQVEAPVMNWDDYRAYLRRLERIWREVYRKMAPGAFAAINIAPIHAKAAYFHEPSAMLPTTERTVEFWLDELGARYRWRYIWVAQRTRNNASGTPTTFLGSYGMRDLNTGETYGLPLRGQVLREVEEVIILQKGGLKLSEEREARRRDPRSRLSLSEWKDAFAQVWTFPGNNRVGDHMAAFPIELPRRIIRAYSCVGDTVLDPFLGSGTTLMAARELGRRGIGYEVEPRFESTIIATTGIFTPSMETQW